MKPLSGLRIIEFDGLGPVTFAGMFLADLGAEVLRLSRSADAGAPAFSEVGGAVLHRGRAAVGVNLKDPGDLAGVLPGWCMAGSPAGVRPARWRDRLATTSTISR